LWPSYLAYALSFLLVGQVWVNHHVMFDRVRHVDALRAEQGLRTAVVVYGTTLWVAAALFNVVWARLRRARLLDSGLGPLGVRAIGRRFALALAWIGSGVLVGAFVPVAGVAIIAAFLPAYYLPIRGEDGEDDESTHRPG
jgi:hypothetical protein